MELNESEIIRILEDFNWFLDLNKWENKQPRYYLFENKKYTNCSIIFNMHQSHASLSGNFIALSSCNHFEFDPYYPEDWEEKDLKFLSTASYINFMKLHEHWINDLYPKLKNYLPKMKHSGKLFL